MRLVGASSFWGGVLTASLIGVTVWTLQIPAQHGVAVSTATACTLVVLTSAITVAFQSTEFLDVLSRCWLAR